MTREMINPLKAIIHILEITSSPSCQGNKRWYHAPMEFQIKLWLGPCRRCYISIISQNLGISSPSLMPMHCDDQVSIFIARNSTFHEHTKHIEIEYHYIHTRLCPELSPPLI